MSVLYLIEPHTFVKLDAETLLIKVPENKALGRMARNQRVPLTKVSQVVVYGNSTLSTPVIEALMEQRTEICYLTAHGKFVARTCGSDHKHGQLRLLQRRVHDDACTRLHVARACVRSKLHNQRTLLLRGNRPRESSGIGQAAERLGRLIDQVDALPHEDVYLPTDHPQEGTVLGQLMGLEGAGAAAYFAGYGALFNSEWAGVFTGRHKRPPTDPINALLSYGYTLLTSQAVGAAYIVGFDPYIGCLHSTQYSKPALALDIIEMFRAPIVDSVVLTLLNNRMLRPDDFEETLGAWRMRDAARKLFLTRYEERLNETITHPVFKTKVTYRRCLELQMRLLARWMQGELRRFREFNSR